MLKHSNRILFRLTLLCFFCYLALLSYLLFFSNYRASVSGTFSYNLLPFKTIAGYFSTFRGGSPADQFFGNILAFMPLGFFLPLVTRRSYSAGKILVVSALTSFGIESAQLLFLVGAFDVDDLILNTVGGLFGSFVLKGFVKLFRQFSSNNSTS
ncbi:VanZ family protein [Metabacillus herbersteinensis]|uniref:VanZ family protein n=1 Tax=Metabacillus herbersteinensis TaxID=283816 RepID=A0ABV6GA73_9BACI